MKLIFIHGRSQESYPADELKQTWTKTLQEGLAKNGLVLPQDVQIEFPYYGKLLKELTDNPSLLKLGDEARRAGFVVDENGFSVELLKELLGEAVAQEEDRGIINNELVQRLLQKLDARTGLGTLALRHFVKDVFYYLTNQRFQETINAEVLKAFDASVPCVVVGHSLGSIVSYVLLRKHPDLKVKKLITIGSPLGIKSVVKQLPRPLEYPKNLEGKWFNAYDEGDVVALNPLDRNCFPITSGSIENKNDVQNDTDNQHGIVGYLNDAVVAREIYEGVG